MGNPKRVRSPGPAGWVVSPHPCVTLKQIHFCHQLFAGFPPAEAAWRAYDCSTRNSARVLACRNLRKPKIRNYIGQQLIEKRLPAASFKVLEDALGAHLIVNGRLTEVPDHEMRTRAANLIIELINLARNAKQEIAKG